MRPFVGMRADPVYVSRKNKAEVALARKLAVILHRMLVDGTPLAAEKAAMARVQKKEITWSSGDTSSVWSEVPSPGRWFRPGQEMLQ